MVANIAELDKFGSFKTIDALAQGDILKYNEVLKCSYITVVTKMQYGNAVAQYQERLMKVKQRNAKNRL